MAKALRVKPILVYSAPQKREATSWREWGGIQTETQAAEETRRIKNEMSSLKVDFPLEFLPLSLVKSETQSDEAISNDADVSLIFGAGGSTELMEHLISGKKWNIMFLRHRSGPLYLWYEIAHPRLLRKSSSDNYLETRLTLDDILVDDYDRLVKMLRALFALKNTVGKKVVAIGGPSGWGIGSKAVELAKQRWNLDITSENYEPELADRIKKKFSDALAIEKARERAKEYASRVLEMRTSADFLTNSFLLYEVFEDVMNDHKADAMTINDCMTTIMPLAKTTACLPLSLINDEGKLAFCESDFVAIPAGILLHYISGQPVFLNDPTFPHDGVVTVAHDTAPSMMGGIKHEVKLHTHFESDYGAAPQVLFKKGQQLTVIDPDFQESKWIIFRARVEKATDYPVCHSQMDIRIDGDWKKLLQDMRGFHWMITYGDYVDELAYALKKVGIEPEIV
ncbi:sugar isomerase [Tardisphaera saccharovorans]